MRKILIGVAIIAALSILSGVLAGPSNLGLHIDTGSVQTNADSTGKSGDQAQGKAAQPKADAKKPDATKGPAKPSATPVSVDPNGLATKLEAFILLNPTSAAPGATVDISGGGFDPGATVDLTVKRSESDKPKDIGFAQADQGGNFGGVSFAIPSDLTGSFTIVAKQHAGGKEAKAQAQVAMGSPKVTLGTAVGTPGADVAFSAEGFLPGESVKVFFNSLSGDAVATFQADQGGGVRRKAVKVPYGAIGNNSFIFVGDKSQAPVTAPFLMLNLYPGVALSSYASKADTVISFDGEGFGPKERVRVHLNSLSSPPLGFVETDEKGKFSNAGGLNIPFELKGKNTLIFVGEKSQSAVTTSFDVLPYTPVAEASTYGGRPGTTVTFYGTGFARDEVVYIYAGATKNSQGKLVACSKTDDQGNLRAGGSYTIPGNAQKGKLTFNLVGKKTNATATTAMDVMDAGGPVQVKGDDQEFKCSLDQPASPAAQQQGQSQQPTQGQAQQPTQSPQPSQGQAQQPTQSPQPSQGQPQQPSQGQPQQPTPGQPHQPAQGQPQGQTQPGQAQGQPQGQQPAAVPTAKPSPSPESAAQGQPKPAPTVAQSANSQAGTLPAVVVANTRGQGTDLLAEPGAKQAVSKASEGAMLNLTGDQKQDNGQVWLKVKDDKGNTGWVDARYLTPAPGQR